MAQWSAFPNEHDEVQVIFLGFQFWAIFCPETLLSGKLEGEKTYEVINHTADAQSGMDKHDEDEDTNYVFAAGNCGL